MSHHHRAVDFLMREGGQGSPLAIEHKVYLDFVGIANPPYDYESRLRPMYPGAFQHLCLMVMDPYDVALTKLKRDSDKDFQDVLQLAEKIPFDLDLFEKRYQEELRDHTTGKPGDNDFTFNRWKEAILEDRAKQEIEQFSYLLFWTNLCTGYSHKNKRGLLFSK